MAWKNALNGMVRRVQVNKRHFHQCVSSTGIPEGDPISVVGMFCFSYLFSCVVDHLSGSRRDLVLPAAYADNWEVICSQLTPLIRLLPGLSTFLDVCRLPVAVDKCWGWCLHPEDRKVLRQCSFREAPLPVVLSAKSLGADISYCLGVAAKARNGRVRSGGLRLVRLAGLRLAFTTELLLSGKAFGSTPCTGVRLQRCQKRYIRNFVPSCVVGFGLIVLADLPGWLPMS